MSYQDFIANFDEVQFCHLQPDAVAQDLAKATVSHAMLNTNIEECFSVGLSSILSDLKNAPFYIFCLFHMNDLKSFSIYLIGMS